MRKRRCLSSCQKALHVKSPEKPFWRCRSHLKHQCQDTASEALSKRSGRGPYNCTTSWMKKIKMELVHCSTSAMTNMSPISLQLRPRERGNSEETDIRRPAVLQAGNGPKNGLLEVDSCFFKLPKRPVSGLCRRPCQRFPPQAIRNQGSDMET